MGNPGSFGNIHVLILEDRDEDAELLVYELRRSGLNIDWLCVQTKRSYIQAIRSFQPHIILSDYDLPGFSGAEALRIREKICPHIPFVLVTGAVSREREVEILAGGATDYISKENTPGILSAVRRACMVL